MFPSPSLFPRREASRLPSHAMSPTQGQSSTRDVQCAHHASPSLSSPIIPSYQRALVPHVNTHTPENHQSAPATSSNFLTRWRFDHAFILYKKKRTQKGQRTRRSWVPSYLLVSYGAFSSRTTNPTRHGHVSRDGPHVPFGQSSV